MSQHPYCCDRPCWSALSSRRSEMHKSWISLTRKERYHLSLCHPICRRCHQFLQGWDRLCSQSTHTWLGSFFTWLHSRLSRYSTHRDQIQRWRSFRSHSLRNKSTRPWSKVTTMIWIIHLRSTQNWILSQRPRYRHWLDRYADDWNRWQTWTRSRLRS